MVCKNPACACDGSCKEPIGIPGGIVIKPLGIDLAKKDGEMTMVTIPYEKYTQLHDKAARLDKLLEEPSDEVVEKVAVAIVDAEFGCGVEICYNTLSKAAIKAYQEAMREE